ncbi:MAG TPA: DNA repair protein RecN [Dysgonamonadaceae bacterium]|nr:DNA repair protein RecN [Dysgonamonadaceae bacterium]HPD43024.1 DNA repair protein RecN [Dysgonamonadaceae bacterium]HRU13655.1 DNA repair protein RecN [Dysgonamonadaceae bacterium]
MLKSLSIENYALIDSLNIEFAPGFSVITGETGAGKSIILGALSLILGQRADARQIKQGENKCLVEGVFDVSKYDLKSLFDEHDWVYEGETCILRREIWANGKSRAFLNDSPVYLNDLKALGDRLIDIHSQHQNLALNDRQFQLLVVDALADTRLLRGEYVSAFHSFRSAAKVLADLKEASRKNKEEEDYLRFQYAALSEAALREGEQEELEAELEALTHSEEIKSGLFAVTNLLSGEDQNVEAMLKSALEAVRNVQSVFPKADEIVQRLESAYLDLKDLRSETERLFDEIEFNPDRQQLVEDRLGVIYDLQKKHSVATVRQLIELRDNIGSKLQNIDSMEEKISSAENILSEKREQLSDLARRLSEKRLAAISDIEKELTSRLSYLGMPNARFECRITPKQQPDETGMDDVQFLFSANKNTDLLPVSQIASGGEISRLMLCVKAMIAGATALPTIIFDEIDTGTSGEMADKMGRIMQDMSRNMQVIAITHLPQIASKGDFHYIVYKKDTEDSTQTYMRQLSSEERITEIARLLSGAETTAQAIENAKVMLRKN